MKSKTILLVGLAAALTASTLQGAPKSKLGKNAEFDVNGDGALSLKEAKASKKAGLVKNFAVIDTDKSGTITGKEINKFWKSQKKAK